MDYNQDGTITIEDMKLNIDPTGHDEVKQGKMKPDEWLTKYLNEFETDVKDGIVTWSEFKQYYQNLSASTRQISLSYDEKCLAHKWGQRAM